VREFRLLQEGSTWELYLPEEFSTESVALAWEEVSPKLEKETPSHIKVFAQDLKLGNASVVAFLLHLRKTQEQGQRGFELYHLPTALRYSYELAYQNTPESTEQKKNYLVSPEKVGKNILGYLQEFRFLVEFSGELAVYFWKSVFRPGTVRWRDAFLVGEAMGVNAFPIIAMIGFLLGLIMSFQSTIPMRRFGAEIFVANLVGLSLFRELGPLMTAFILSGRSGSAFAAEIGTMKVSEEIDALTTMGLPPVQFLIIPRLFAALVMTPLLTVVFNLFGLMGGALVLYSFGFPFVTFLNQVNIAVGFNDIMGGMVKSFFFGLVIAGMGCYQGLKTTLGAKAVGESTTAAVVGSIILVSVLDGVFSVTFYYLGI